MSTMSPVYRGSKPDSTDYRSLITDYRLPTTDYRLPITDYRSPIRVPLRITVHPGSPTIRKGFVKNVLPVGDLVLNFRASWLHP